MNRKCIMEYSHLLGRKVKRKSFEDCHILSGIFRTAEVNKIDYSKARDQKERSKMFKKALSGKSTINLNSFVELLNTFDEIQYNGHNGKERSNFCSECQHVIKERLKGLVYFKRGHWYLKEKEVVNE
jgi:hypothetical protein